MKDYTKVRCIEHNKPAEQCEHGGHYGIYEAFTMEHIKNIFPEGKANSLNWFVASTSGVHGTSTDLKEIEKTIKTPIDQRIEDDENYYPTELTFLIIMPRMVTVTYGNVEIQTQEEIDYLRGLIKSSVKEIAKTQANNI